MNRVSIIVILGSALLSTCGCAETAGTATASMGGSSQVSTERTAPTNTVDNAPQSAQPATAPQPIPGADQNRTNQTPTNANEDSDLARIPTDPQPAADTHAKAPSTGAANERIYLENAFTQTGQRGGLIVPSPQLSAPSPWQERVFLDVRKVWRLDERLNFSLSHRLNLRAQNDISLPNHENVINDFREGFLSWQPHDGIYLDFGRINLRSGAALGFNHTDFFKSRAVVEPLSADPSVLREDRLGTLMLETQYVGQGRALTVAVAPALVGPGPISTHTNLPSFNPSIDRTNHHDRILVKGSFAAGNDFNPELLSCREGGQNRLGANLTRGLVQKVIAYAERSSAMATNLLADSPPHG